MSLNTATTEAFALASRLFTSPAATMRAAVLTGPHRFELLEVPIPRCSPEQVLVRLQGCGVCSSSLPLWEGRPWFSYPVETGAPGHEGWGVVEAVGEHVTAVAKGDRVAMLSHRAFAEYDVADQHSVVRLAHPIDARPFPGEAFGCGFNVWSRSEVTAQHTVAIVGVGFLGGLLVRLARTAGARVIAISRRKTSLDLAARLGADEVVPMVEGTAAAVMELTGGRGCERVIEATGMQRPLDLAASLVATRGRLVIAGFHQDGLREVDLQSWNWRGIDVINAHERKREAYLRGMREAAGAVADGLVDPAPLLTHTFPLEQLGEALDATQSRPEGFVKAVIHMDGAAPSTSRS